MKISAEKLADIIEEELEQILLEEGWRDRFKKLKRGAGAAALAGTLAASPASAFGDVTDEPQISDSEEGSWDPEPLDYDEPELPSGLPSFVDSPENSEEDKADKKKQTDKEVQRSTSGSPTLRLEPQYKILQTLGNTLPRYDSRFNMDTEEGRAAIAIALAIGGTEVYGSIKNPERFFTMLGGYKTDPQTGKRIYNKMKGFAQFDIDLHGKKINTARKYTTHLGNIITGLERMPNSGPSSDFVGDLSARVNAGEINNGKQLRAWFQANGFGGSNWQGIDAGWGRVPRLGDQLVDFIKGETDVKRRNDKN